LSDRFLESLVKYTGLRRFSGEGKGITSRGLREFLHAHATLTELSLSGCRLDPDYVAAIISHPALKLATFDEADCPAALQARLTNGESKVLVRLVPPNAVYETERRTVWLLEKSGPSLLRRVSTWSEVRDIRGTGRANSFWKDTGITDEGAAFLLRMPNLENLELNGSYAVTDRVLDAIPTTTKLKWLSTDATKISRQRIAKLLTQFPSIQVFPGDN
jgi:hypothetical protein